MRSILFITLFFIVQQAWSQADDFNSLVKKWQGSVSQVATGSKTFEQEILSPMPASIRYNYTEVAQKGTKTAYAYEFNLADIDPYAVRSETQKDLIMVVLTVRNKQKLAKVYKNDEVQAYDESVKILVKNIDDAREMVDIIKKAIPLAEKIMTNRLKLAGYNEMITWLFANVKDVKLGTKAVKQKLGKGDNVGSVKLVSIATDGKTTHEENFELNLADINVNSVAFKIRGNQFAVNFEMAQQLKSIYYKKDGEVKSFQDELSIETNSVDEARDLKTVLSLVVPLAVTKVTAEMPLLNSEADGFKIITSYLKDVTYGTHSISQSMEPKCLTTFTQVTKDSGSSEKTEKNTFVFNWMDLNPSTYQIEVSGEKMFIDVVTLEKKKLILRNKNDIADGYESETRFYAENMEAARRMKFAMDKVIDQCKKSYREPFQPDLKSTVTYLQKTIGEVNVEEINIKQTFEPVSENNKIKFTKITVNASKSTEEIYEFNLSDISPTSVTYDIEGKVLLVVFESNFKNKIINYYKDGKIQPYVYKLDMAMPQAETARNVISAMKKSIEKLKAK